MNAILWHAWREVRAQRSVLLAYLLLLLVGAPVAACLVPRQYVEDGSLVAVGVAFGYLFAALLLGTEALPGEAMRGTLGFLTRLPGGLARAYCGKVLVLGAALFCLPALGWVATSLARLLVIEGAWHDPVDAWRNPVADTVLGAGALAAWLFALAGFLTRGLLALPALALLFGPIVFTLRIGSGARHEYTLTEPWESLQIPLALAIGWLVFVHGRKFSRGLGRAAARALPALLVVLAPGWALAGYLHWCERTPDFARGLTIRSGSLSVDGRFAYLNTSAPSPLSRAQSFFPLQVNLVTGSWQLFGPPGHCFQVPAREQRGLPVASAHDWLWLTDGTSGEWTRTASATHAAEPSTEDLRRDLRTTTPIRLQDGRRAWFLERRLEVESADGGIATLPWDPRDIPHSAAGLGLRVYCGDRSPRLYDLGRAKLYRQHAFAHGCALVLETGWLVADLDRQRPVSWRLFDPETGHAEPVSALQDGDRVAARLDDGRVLLLRGQEPWAWHPQTRVLQPLRWPGNLAKSGVASPGKVVALGDCGAWPLRAPDGSRIFCLSGLLPGGGTWLAVLPPGGTSFGVAFQGAQIVGFPGAATALHVGTDCRSLWQIDLRTGLTRQVFPAP